MTGSDPDPTRLLRRVVELRSRLTAFDPQRLVEATGTYYHVAPPGESYFSVCMWQQDVRISYPDFTAFDERSGAELPLFTQAMLMYYFTTADGTPLAGEWLSFSQLPDGRFYNQAFQGYTGGELARVFHTQAEFEQAARKMGGEAQLSGSQTPGTVAFKFQAFPKISLLVAFWEGDEDFPVSFQVLFDASVAHYMPTDGCALLGSSLTRMLLKAR